MLQWILGRFDFLQNETSKKIEEMPLKTSAYNASAEKTFASYMCWDVQTFFPVQFGHLGPGHTFAHPYAFSHLCSAIHCFSCRINTTHQANS